jgi:hypothetical protein
MNFKNMKAFFKLVLPKMEMLRRPTATTCTLSKDTAGKVFGEKGIPFSVLNQTEASKEAENSKTGTAPDGTNTGVSAPSGERSNTQNTTPQNNAANNGAK